MKKLIWILGVLAFPFALSACAGQQPSAASTPQSAAAYRSVTPAEAKDWIGQDGVVLVDVRTAEEYAAGYIPGAILLPVDDVAAKASAVLPDKGAKIIVYCRSGRRSAAAAQTLAGMGYTDVYDLGGIQSWPYDIVKK